MSTFLQTAPFSTPPKSCSSRTRLFRPSIPARQHIKMTLKSNSNGDFRFEHADEGISMVDLNMGLKMDAHNSYSFSSQALSCPSSCPSTAGSFSSASSHYDDPFTPTSRTSTPQQPISLDTSFDSDSLIFDFTPPPSASTGYFPPDLKSTVAPSMLSSHALPSTPSRCNNLFDTALSFDGLNFTPTQDMDSSYQFDPLGSSPFMIPTPPPPFNRSMQNCDLLSVWGQNADGSPITFSSPAVPLARQTPTPLGSSHSSSRRRVAMDRPQHSSAMLQQHLHQSSAKPRLSKPKSSTGKSNAPGQKGFRVNKNGAKVGFTEKSKHVCHLCKKAYTRQEHLKRHMAGR